MLTATGDELVESVRVALEDLGLEREEDPAQRNVALVGRDDDLTAFAENHGNCLIDTRDLFRLRQLVSAGQISTDEARTELKAASARYMSPPDVKA